MTEDIVVKPAPIGHRQHVVVFREFPTGYGNTFWAAIAYPGPTGTGGTPNEALENLQKSWPEFAP